MEEKKGSQIPERELELIVQDLLEKWKKQGLDTELSMICTNCGNDVGLTKFLVHVGSSLLKSIVVLLGEEFFKRTVSAVLDAILSTLMPTRGLIDTSMAQLANDYEMTCQKCKKTPFWKEVSAFNSAVDASEENLSNQ